MEQKSIPLYYLLINNNIDATYLQLSRTLIEYKITLIPVTLSQFKELADNKRQLTIVFVESQFKHRIWFRRELRGFLGFLLQARSLTLYHISCFGAEEKFHNLTGHKIYNYFQLPISYGEIAHKIISNIVEKWPGGRGPKLPHQVNEGSA